MGRRLAFDCLFPNRKSAQAQLKVALCRDAAKTCNNNKIETPISVCLSLSLSLSNSTACKLTKHIKYHYYYYRLIFYYLFANALSNYKLRFSQGASIIRYNFF